jgi:hypothetical protein
MEHERTPNGPTPSVKNETGEYERFTEFMKRLVAVPHDRIKARLDAEREAKKQRLSSRASSEKR